MDVILKSIDPYGVATSAKGAAGAFNQVYLRQQQVGSRGQMDGQWCCLCPMQLWSSRQEHGDCKHAVEVLGDEGVRYKDAYQ